MSQNSPETEAKLRLNSEIFSKFLDSLDGHVPPLGDCERLPYPKMTILKAIAWLRSHFGELRETVADQDFQQQTSETLETLNFFTTCLARNWHQIEPQDKARVTQLQSLDAFPEWALDLEQKYIDENKASDEALEATFQVIREEVEIERETREQMLSELDKRADEARARLRARFGSPKK